jgi:succinyldiaminopimelate transaminase
VDALEPPCEPGGDARTELVEALPRPRRDQERVGKPVRQAAAAQGVDLVGLVQDELAGQLGRADLRQHRVDGFQLLVEACVGRGCVGDVQDEVGDERLLQRRRETLDELMGKPADEADGIRQEVSPSVVLERARRRVQRLEESIPNRHIRVRQGVQERRLTHVRVPGQCDRGCLGALPLTPPGRALAAQLVEAAAQQLDAPSRHAAVALELRLAGPAGADAGAHGAAAAAQALEVLPRATHAREVVVELSELDLQLAFGADRVLGEDVEDQLCAIDHTGGECVLQRPLLRRRELVVHDQNLRAGLLVGGLELLELPLADVRAAIRTRAVLRELADRLDARGLCQLAELREPILRIHGWFEHGEGESALQLGTGRSIGLTGGHRSDYAAERHNPRMALVSPLLARTGTYPFVRLEEAKRRVQARGIEVVDMGIGDPRERADPRIERALVEALPEVSGYPLAQGLPELRSTIAAWTRRRFAAELDPEREVIPTLGSKEAIFSLALALLDRDAGPRTVAYTEPAYPVYERGALFAGGNPLALPLTTARGFLPDLDAVDWDGVALLWINYPNNPTGAVAGLDFYEQAAELARRHDFVLASDEAYTELWYDEPPPSALQLSDRTNVLVFNSLSKRSSMTGYRSGFAAGDPELVATLRAFRPTVGTAPQEFVQRAAIAAWEDESHVERNRGRYREKREVLLGALGRAGLRVAASEATIYLWVEVPEGEPCEAFATRVLERGVVVSPGSYFGPSGEGYVRIALTPPLPECERAAEILESL